MTRPGIEHRSPGSLADTLRTYESQNLSSSLQRAMNKLDSVSQDRKHFYALQISCRNEHSAIE